MFMFISSPTVIYFCVGITLWLNSSFGAEYFLLSEILIDKCISQAYSTIESDIVSYMMFVRDTEMNNRYTVY